MNKYNDLLARAKELVEELKAETDKATNEDDMNDLETVAQTLISGIPDRLVLCDYYDRTTVRDFLEEDKQEDTDYIDKVMIKCYEKSAIYINEDYAYENVRDCIAFVDIENDKGVSND